MSTSLLRDALLPILALWPVDTFWIFDEEAAPEDPLEGLFRRLLDGSDREGPATG